MHNAGAVTLSLVPGISVTFLAANTYQGGTTFTSGGTFIVGNNSALGTGPVTFGIGTMQSDSNHTLANNFTISSSAFIDGAQSFMINRTINLGTNNLSNGNTGTTTLSGIISDGNFGGSIAQNSVVGTLLSGNNTYTGGTTLTSGDTFDR